MKELVISHVVVEAKYLCPGDYFFTSDNPYPYLTGRSSDDTLHVKATQEIFVDTFQVSKVRYFSPGDKVYMLLRPRVVD